jgi:WD40 repeat protein
VAFTAGGKALAGVGNETHLWDLDTGKEQTLVSRVPLAGPARFGTGFVEGGSNTAGRNFLRSATAGPNGKAPASSIGQSNVVVWDVAGRQEQVAIQGTPGLVKDISFTDDGSALAVVHRSISGVTRLRVWSLVRRPECLVVPDAQGVAFAPDGKAVVTVVGDKLKRVEIDSGREDVLAGGQAFRRGAWPADLPRPRDEVLAGGQAFRPFVVDSSPDGKALVLAFAFGLTIWDVGRGKQRFPMRGDPEFLRFSPDGKALLLANREGGFKVLDARSGEETWQLPGGKESGPSAAFSPDGRVLATGRKGDLSQFVAPDGRVSRISRKGEPLRLWDTRTRKPRTTLSKDMIPLAFLRDSDLLLVAFAEKVAFALKVWDLRKGREHSRLRTLGEPFPRLALAADGKALAVVGADVEVWDTASGQLRLKLPIPREEGGWVAFSPDGRFLAFAGGKSGVRVWDTRPIQEKVIRPGPLAGQGAE